MKFRFAISMLVLTVILLIAACRKKVETPPLKAPGEIVWLTNLDTAKVIAGRLNKPLMIDFMAEWCPPCQEMEKTTFNQPAVIAKAGEFVTVRIDVDKQGDVANAYNCNANKYGGVGIPNMLFMDFEDYRLRHVIGYREPEKLLSVMDSVLTEFAAR